MIVVLRTLFALVPVCLFLGSLLYIDSYKLVGMKRLLRVIVAGGAAALTSYLINKMVLGVIPLDHRTFTRFAAPVAEEALKLVPILYLLRTRRIGFVIDAAILGFAAGTGFA